MFQHSSCDIWHDKPCAACTCLCDISLRSPAADATRLPAPHCHQKHGVYFLRTSRVLGLVSYRKEGRKMLPYTTAGHPSKFPLESSSTSQPRTTQETATPPILQGSVRWAQQQEFRPWVRKCWAQALLSSLRLQRALTSANASGDGAQHQRTYLPIIQQKPKTLRRFCEYTYVHLGNLVDGNNREL